MTNTYDRETLNAKYLEVTGQMFEIMKRKNADYAGTVGAAFANFDQIELITKGMISREMGTVVRMTDKLSRVVRLLQNSNQVLDEKIEDTLLDLANYSILLILMLREEDDGTCHAVSTHGRCVLASGHADDHCFAPKFLVNKSASEINEFAIKFNGPIEDIRKQKQQDSETWLSERTDPPTNGWGDQLGKQDAIAEEALASSPCGYVASPGPPLYASSCRLAKGHDGDCDFGSPEEAHKAFYSSLRDIAGSDQHWLRVIGAPAKPCTPCIHLAGYAEHTNGLFKYCHECGRKLVYPYRAAK